MPAKRLSDFRKDNIELVPIAKMKFDGEWVLAFDQSMASSGWVLLTTDEDNNPLVIKTGMVKTDPTGKGSFEDTYARMQIIWDEFWKVIGDTRPTRIVHEMPAVYGKRTEASLLASLVLRLVAAQLGHEVSMVSAQRVKKIIAGKPNASKDEVKSAVKSLIPTIVQHRPLNEHIYDATAVGLSSMVVK